MSDTMYDSVQWTLIPRGALYIAVYGNGRFAADTGEVASTYPKARVYIIDVIGDDPGASIKDVETGDLSINNLPQAIEARFNAHPDSKCRVYCNLSTWPSVKEVVAAGVNSQNRSQIVYWVANPTFPPFPHFVPGSNATQYSFGTDYDTSIIGDAFK
jgi:hypothetical protein